MWQEIKNAEDLSQFMTKMCFFHDSCIKEFKYVSGAYVNEDLTMHPINDRRILSVIIQRQSQDNSMIEMEFAELKYLKLFPITEKYTCEILDASMFFRNELIYWCECSEESTIDFENSDETIICASKFRWRPIECNMGGNDFYISSDDQGTVL